MSIYTIVFELDGGTYVSQSRKEDIDGALADWVENLKREKPFGSTQSTRIANAVGRAIVAGGLAPLSGLTGVWCFTGLYADRLFVGHVVQS